MAYLRLKILRSKRGAALVSMNRHELSYPLPLDVVVTMAFEFSRPSSWLLITSVLGVATSIIFVVVEIISQLFYIGIYPASIPLGSD